MCKVKFMLFDRALYIEYRIESNRSSTNTNIRHVISNSKFSPIMEMFT